MKKLILLALLTLTTWANGSFYNLYAQNRVSNRANLITADFIASAYATYKLSREQTIEEKILKPRVLNFANYLYQGVTEVNLPNKEQLLAYTGVLSLLAKGGQNLTIPDGYEHLQGVIVQEAKLIMEANKKALSPVLKVSVNYRAFKVPNKYANNATYFRTMKYAQTMPLSTNLKRAITQIIQASERLSNLENHIKQTLEQFVGVEQKSNRLFSSYRGLDYFIFKKSKKPSIKDIEHAIKTDPITKQHLLNLYSSNDYDFKIMQTLLKNNHKSAFNGYYIQSHYRNLLYKRLFHTKANQQTSRVHANIETKLEETLNVMIEGALMFSNALRNNQTDKNMITTLKKLRKIAQKKSMSLKLTPLDINFLNNLDLIFLEIIGVQDRPLKIKISNRATEQLLAPKAVGFGDRSWGGRYVYKEILSR